MTSEREKLILKSVIQHFIDTGSPVGSRFLSRRLAVHWSAATIRNIMADLEDQGYLDHPHKSAGRIPTDRGYRSYVNGMMDLEELSAEEKKAISCAVSEISVKITRISEGVDEILYLSSKALSKISNELGIILSPRFNLCIFDRVVLARVEGDRILIEINLKSGMVKTVVLDVHSRISPEDLVEINRVLNERLSGLSVSEIRKSIGRRMYDVQLPDYATGFVRLFIESADTIFNFDKTNLFSYTGTQNILSKPDFYQNEILPILQSLEEKSIWVDLLSQRTKNEGVAVTIGQENDGKEISNCTIVTANYRMGGVTGTVGVIGPKRMPYGKIIPLVEYTAAVLDRIFNKN